MKDEKLTLLKSDLRKIERQAKQLMYKMERLHQEWLRIGQEIKKNGGQAPRQLGDVLQHWQTKSIR